MSKDQIPTAPPFHWVKIIDKAVILIVGIPLMIYCQSKYGVVFGIAIALAIFYVFWILYTLLFGLVKRPLIMSWLGMPIDAEVSRLADQAEESGDYVAAVLAIQDVILRKGEDYYRLGVLAASMREAGRAEQALEVLHRSESMCPKNVKWQWYAQRADTLWTLGRNEEALRDIEVVLEARWPHSGVYCVYSKILADLGRRQDAEKACAKAEEKLPAQPVGSKKVRAFIEKMREEVRETKEYIAEKQPHEIEAENGHE